MPVWTPAEELIVKKWRKRVWHDYQRDNLFSEFMGSGDAAVIQRVLELNPAGYNGGEEIIIPLMALPKSGGVVGDQILVGNEHDLTSYGYSLRADWWRDAIILNKKQMNRSVIDQMEEVRPALTQIAANRLRDDIIRALHNVGGSGLGQGTYTALDTANSVSNVNGVYYRIATPAQRNAWHVANQDRIQYGALKSNYVAGDHAASLANVDSTNDKFNYAALERMKRIAKSASPKIHPMRVEGGREYYLIVVGTRGFRDLKADPRMDRYNVDARARGVDSNPIFQGGDLIGDGVMVREIPELDDLALIPGAGTGGIDVGPAFILGRQAIAYAVGQTPQPTERNEDDYGFVKGRGIETFYGIGKTQFVNRNINPNPAAKDWGVGTGYFSATDDA